MKVYSNCMRISLALVVYQYALDFEERARFLICFESLKSSSVSQESNYLGKSLSIVQDSGHYVTVLCGCARALQCLVVYYDPLQNYNWE